MRRPIIEFERPLCAWIYVHVKKQNSGVGFHDFPFSGKKNTTCHAFYLPFQICSWHSCTRTIIGIARKSPLEVTLEYRETISCFAKRSLFVTCQKWKQTFYSSSVVLRINCVPHVMNHVTVWILWGEIQLCWRSAIDLTTDFKLHLLGWQNKAVSLM